VLPRQRLRKASYDRNITKYLRKFKMTMKTTSEGTPKRKNKGPTVGGEMKRGTKKKNRDKRLPRKLA